MNKKKLLAKTKKYLKYSFVESSDCCEKYIEDWVDAVMAFRDKVKHDCCLKTLRSLQHFILEESSDTDYIVRKNAMFGDLKEIRRDGFERRYLYNIKITKTYIEAYKKTEKEYFKIFQENRYASYDSFRNVRNRYLKKK